MAGPQTQSSYLIFLEEKKGHGLHERKRAGQLAPLCLCYNKEMDKLIESYNKSKNLHHAYFLIGQKEIILYKLLDFFEKKLKIKIVANPDFYLGEFDNLGIDSAKAITERSEMKSFGGNLKIFVIYANTINIEAQNSLLKTFEEPAPNTHFFIISPQDLLLPTLRSRMLVSIEESKEEESDSILNLKLKDRLLKVKEIIEEISEEEKTKQDAISLINEIEKELYSRGVEKSAYEFEICERAREYLHDRGAPVKMILENVMLSI